MAGATTSNVYQTNIPEQLLPYEQNLLDQAQAFTDISKYPYQQYQGERVAQFDPLQQQAMQGAGQLGVQGQVGAASNLAGAAGLGALGTQYDPSRFYTQNFNSPFAAQSYMSPYLMSALAPQMQLLQQQQGIQANQLASQASQAGAFGGSRYGLQQGLQNQANQLAMSNLVGQGFNTAYQNAMNQFNQDQARQLQAQQLGEQSRQFGANLGMQGLQTGLQAANTLGNLGQTQYNQLQGAIGTQAQLGGMAQQQAQNILNNQYQDFLNYQNYPYKQMGFMSDIIRGAPLTQTGAAVYQGSPTTMQNLMGAGLGAYGFNQLFSGKKEGGAIKGYKAGGISRGDVTSQENKEDIVDTMHPDGLPRAYQAAMARGDMPIAQAAQSDMAEDAAIRAEQASIDRGLGSAFNQLPQQTQTRMLAGGGMVAFAEGDLVQAPKTMAEGLSQLYSAQYPEALSAEDYATGVGKQMKGLESLYPKSELSGIADEMLADRRRRVDEASRMGKAQMALLAAKGVLTPSGSRGMAEMYGGLSEGLTIANKLNNEAQAQFDEARMLGAKAKDARSMGLFGKAMDLQAAQQGRLDKAYEAKQARDRVAVQALGTAESHREDAASRERVARIQAESQRYAADRPSADERQMQRMEDIYLGKQKWHGKTGEEGVQAFLKDRGALGEAASPYKYYGPTKDTEHRVAIEKEVSKRLEMLDTRIGMFAGKTDPKSVAELQRLQKLREEQANKIRAEMGGSGATSGKVGASRPITQAEYNALPSGTPFTAPDGSIRVKP